MDYAGTFTICEKCKSCKDGKCQDYFEPGVKYPCVNYLEKDNEDRRNNI